MAQFQWQFDVSTGTLKNHHLSSRLYKKSIEETVFMEHVQPVGDGLGKNKGESVTLTRLSQIAEPSSVVLEEGVRIPEDEFTVGTTSIVLQEVGRAVPYTSLAKDLLFFNLENEIQRALRDQLALSLDTLVASVFKQAAVKYIPTGETSRTIDTAGTPSTTALANMNVYHLEEIYDYMYDTLRVPTIGGDYIGIFRHHALRGIMRDPAWEEWKKYTDPQSKFNSEVGRMERIRLIDTNHANALGKLGLNDVLGEGVVFGQDAVGMVEAQTPELRAALPADFGRSKAVAWYGILNFGLIWETGNAGEAKVIHVTSNS